VADPPGGTVATGRRGVVGVGEYLAERFATTVVAVRVLSDRQLAIAMWEDGEELGRYVSDPSRGPGADRDVMSEPLGAENAEEFAGACAHPEAGSELTELLDEELDTSMVYESERLATVLRLLKMPTWLVAAAPLPKDIPTGPRSKDLTRLRAGVPGPAGLVSGWAVGVVRRRTPPAPVIDDPPRRTSSGMNPWLM
jgi:hypothetical protein